MTLQRTNDEDQIKSYKIKIDLFFCEYIVDDPNGFYGVGCKPLVRHFYFLDNLQKTVKIIYLNHFHS